MKIVSIITLFILITCVSNAQNIKDDIAKKPVYNSVPKYNEFFTVEMETAVDEVLKKMTLEEKLTMLQGDIDGQAPPSRGSAAVKRLNVEPLIFYNGPRGLQTSYKSTLFPTGIAQAASFRPELVKKIGAAISSELLEAGWDVLEAPSINIIRDPLNGRNFEYYTEDPYLNAKVTSAFILGGQGAGALNSAKHFIGNNKEQNRGQVNAVIDERAMHEIYLPAFKAACEVGVLSIMTGANRVNGPHASDNPDIINILKDEWNWQGFLYTDWNGVQTSKEAYEAGLDLSMPGKVKSPFRVDKLKPIANDGKENLLALDDKVKRLLRGNYFAGKLPGVPAKPKVIVDYDKHHQLAFDAALASMVLVKNNNKLLPISSKVNKIAVLGPMANKQFSKESGGSSGVRGVMYEITALQGLKKRFGNKVTNVPFSINELYKTIAAPNVYHIDKTGKKREGFLATYTGKHPNTDKKNIVHHSTPDINFNWEMASPDRDQLSSDKFIAEWTGTLVPPASGDYTIRIKGSQKVTLELDGKLVSNKQFIQRFRETTMALKGGKKYKIKLTFRKARGDGNIQLSWITPNSEKQLNDKLEKSVETARNAEFVVLAIGLDHNTESEGMDRLSMRLQEYQDKLVERVLAVNPNTAIIVYGGTPMSMPWFDKAPALVLPWYAGIENGNALASLLAGDNDFGGRMPVTFPKKYEDSPAAPFRQNSAKKDTIEHNEGVFVGYRWYESQKIEPLISFGEGLSYSTYSYGKPKIKKEGKSVTVSMTIKNTGMVKGIDVVQLYIHDQQSTFPRPLKELKGFQSILLAPGETKSISFNLDESAFSYYNPDTHKWWLESGKFDILIGQSSNKILNKISITL
ncbi:beta-glucosidase [Algibacter sp. L3A6]|uniref:beta-glucosidase n=1 Tax=Algibacter sp. L3A6 TaxID=2686366 RepID=UPI00131BFF58|nr:glycoside hydrolase family 3 C-terminal domain-containing protein [Algibacter sp. L3A6]